LKREGPSFRGTELDQVVAYETARALEATGDERAAHDAFLATAKAHPYPSGDLTDDSLWHATEIDEKAGKFDEAIAHMRELLSWREPSQTVGSYNRQRYSQAQMKIAEIYRDGLRDDRAARREFHKVYTDHVTSIVRDDALWYEATLAAKDGDRSDAC